MRVWRTLLHDIDNVFRLLSPKDSPFRCEPVLMKKLKQGNCSWDTVKLILGWIIGTVNMNLELHLHRVLQLRKILDSIPHNQHRTSAKKRLTVLRELRSMALTLPGAHNISSRLHNALDKDSKIPVTLDKGVCQALYDFPCMADNMTARPTCITELAPLSPSAEGYHDAIGSTRAWGGVLIPSNTLNPREGWKAEVLVAWSCQLPECIAGHPVTSKETKGTIANSDLELASGLFQFEYLVQTFDFCKCTALSKYDNLNTILWERNVSTTTNSPPVYLI